LSIQLYKISRLSILGGVPPFGYTSSWPAVQLNTGTSISYFPPLFSKFSSLVVSLTLEIPYLNTPTIFSYFAQQIYLSLFIASHK
jgi:hypothetical protein